MEAVTWRYCQILDTGRKVDILQSAYGPPQYVRPQPFRPSRLKQLHSMFIGEGLYHDRIVTYHVTRVNGWNNKGTGCPVPNHACGIRWFPGLFCRRSDWITRVTDGVLLPPLRCLRAGRFRRSLLLRLAGQREPFPSSETGNYPSTSGSENASKPVRSKAARHGQFS